MEKIHTTIFVPKSKAAITHVASDVEYCHEEDIDNALGLSLSLYLMMVCVAWSMEFFL